MKFVGRIVVVGAMCSLFMTISHLNGQNITEIRMNQAKFKEFHFDHVEEFSGESLLMFDDEDESEKNILNLLIITRTKSLQRKQVLIRFKARFPWNDKYRDKNSLLKEILDETFSKYFADLLVKYGQNSLKLKFAELTVNPTEFVDFVHVSLKVTCENEKSLVTRVSECQSIVERVVKNFSVKELLIYYHEFGYSESINQGEEC